MMSTTQHLGDTHPKTWKGGATCEQCIQATGQARADVYNGSPLIGIVPGGSKDTADVRWRRDFGPGLDAYDKARKEGLQPDHSDLKAVTKAQQRVRGQEDAIRKIKNFSDIDGLKTAPGVDRSVK